MTDSQIEALARVYAEVMNPVDDYSEVSIIYERPIDMDIDYDSAKRFLTWLSQRYCIVEKSKVIAEYKRVIEAVEAMRKWNLTLSEEKLAKADLLISLFPSIAKEIEE